MYVKCDAAKLILIVLISISCCNCRHRTVDPAHGKRVGIDGVVYRKLTEEETRDAAEILAELQMKFLHLMEENAAAEQAAVSLRVLAEEVKVFMRHLGNISPEGLEQIVTYSQLSDKSGQDEVARIAPLVEELYRKSSSFKDAYDQ